MNILNMNKFQATQLNNGLLKIPGVDILEKGQTSDYVGMPYTVD